MARVAQAKSTSVFTYLARLFPLILATFSQYSITKSERAEGGDALYSYALLGFG